MSTSVVRNGADLTRLAGSDAVVEWFGEWPSFHDAEITEVVLSREGCSYLRLHAWKVSSETDGQGMYTRAKEAIVSFVIREITAMELRDLNGQNVIAGLTVTFTHESGWRVSLHGSYGLSGYIDADNVSVDIDQIRDPAGATKSQ